MIKKLLSSFILATASFSLYAEAPSLPIVKVDGKDYYCYNASKDDSLYGIAKQFGWDLGILAESNKGIDGSLKNNQRILYPVSLGSIGPDNGIIRHKVRSGETIYGISKRYGASLEAVYRSNPKAADGINPGDIILIDPSQDSSSDTFVYEVKHGDTLYSLAKQYNTSVKNIIAANKGLNETNLRAGDIIRISPAKPEETVPATQQASIGDTESAAASDMTETAESEAAIPEESKAVVSLILAQDNTKRDSEFTRGILEALDVMKHSGTSVDFRVYPGSPAKITQTLQEITQNPSQAVIATYDKEFPPQLIDFAKATGTPLINAFDIKGEDYLTTPGMLHLLPGSDYFNSKIADDILNRFKDYMYVFIGDNNQDGIGEQLEKEVMPVDKINISTPSQLSGLDITDNSKLIVYSYQSKKDGIAATANAVAALRDKYPLADIKLIGRPNWIVYDGSLKEEFFKADTYIPSRFYFNPDGFDEKLFLDNYRELFNQTPARSFPMYSVMGYDIMRYIIPMLTDSNRTFPSETGNSSAPTPLQLDFNIRKAGDNGGYLNETVYLLRFAPYGSIDKILIK